MARFAPKPCGRIGRERKLCRVKAVRTMAMARFAPKPCGRIGRERRLCRAKAVRSMAMARFAPKPCRRADISYGSEGERTGAKALSCQSRADERTVHEAEAKMGVILALRR